MSMEGSWTIQHTPCDHLVLWGEVEYCRSFSHLTFQQPTGRFLICTCGDEG